LVTNRAGQTLRSSYTEGEQQFHRQSGILTGSLLVLVRNIFSTAQIWRARARFRRELAARSDRELQDMGTCWSSIAYEISKPFWRA
jgi:uncharacterized protein YjiS (DUF1127 family)